MDLIESLQDGQYRGALEKWDAALHLAPETAVLHEQKAQVHLELGNTWQALQAATSKVHLCPSNVSCCLQGDVRNSSWESFIHNVLHSPS